MVYACFWPNCHHRESTHLHSSAYIWQRYISDQEVRNASAVSFHIHHVRARPQEGGDPAGITFHNSAQRVLWIQGLRNAVDRDEAEVFSHIRKREYEDCQRAGRNNCGFGRF